MTYSRTILLAALAILASAAMSAFGQDFEESAAQTAPDLRSLDAGWWSYFVGAEEDVSARVDEFLVSGGSSGVPA